MSSVQQQVAKVVETVLNPFIVFSVLFFTVAVSEAGRKSALTYIAVEIVAIALCCTYLYIQRQRNRTSSYWIPKREQRIVPALVLLSIGSLLLITLFAFSAPGVVIAMVGAIYTASIVATAVTLAWQISVHTMVAGYCAAVSFMALGALWGLMFVAATVVLVWARVIYGAHTLSQAVSGACLGAVVGAVFLSQL